MVRLDIYPPGPQQRQAFKPPNPVLSHSSELPPYHTGTPQEASSERSPQVVPFAIQRAQEAVTGTHLPPLQRCLLLGSHACSRSSCACIKWMLLKDRAFFPCWVLCSFPAPGQPSPESPAVLSEHSVSTCVEPSGARSPFREEQAFLGVQPPFDMQLPVLDEKTREAGVGVGAEDKDRYYQPGRELCVPTGWTKDTSSPFLSSASHPSGCHTTLSLFSQPSSAFPV